MFFLLFGTRVRSKQRGTYVDVCASCNDLAPFVVFTQNEVSHIYYIPLGSGVDRNTFARCLQCQTLYSHEPARMASLLFKGDEKGRTIEDVYRETHPRLVYVLDVCSWAEKGAAAANESEKTALLECVQVIRFLESRHVDTSVLAGALANWETASDGDKRTLREALQARALRGA